MENSLVRKLDELKVYMRSIMGKTCLSPNNIVGVVVRLMNLVELYKEISGFQKKMLVIDSIRNFANENIEDDKEKEYIISLSNSILPDMIDSLVDAIDGKIKFIKENKEKRFFRR